ncbi:putative metalloprotease [Saccharomonospora marina XMU15]|uniref:Putative metalloprotease n=1 Tax=Saccharomonospora marina XMU15 TaxID=882083 RepID=H5X2X1_9PSEU|nr:neutral zinc metallopeptidase [Saccharomonospora marina]EHR52113.1 putative metalloprotease [Saccharomonospora marina XMU15]
MNRIGGRGASRPWRTTFVTAAVATVATVALLATACGTETPGKLQTVGDIAGLPVTHFESGFKPNAPTPRLAVRNVSGSQEDKVAVAAIADVSDYWTQLFPRHFGQQFRPVRSLLSYDPEADEIEVCGATTADAAMNAFYCPPEDLVAWDRSMLLPLLRERFGPMAIVTVLGHEYGHAVQYRLGERAGIDEQTSTIVKEQQADCFTGAYFRWMAEDNSKYFTVSTSEGLNQVMASLFFIRDEPGQSAAEASAHGTAFDRTYAFQLGFEQGALKCADIDQAEVDSRITEQPFDPNDSSGGDLRISEETVALLQRSLDQAFAGAQVETPKIVDDGGSCPDGPDTAPASYCPEGNTVSIDLATLADFGQPIDREAEFRGTESDGGLGDFAAFAEIASRYVQGIQHGVGASVDNANAGLRTSCLVGAWAGAISGDDHDNVLRLSPGDLDEAIAELLQPRSLIAADLNGHRVANGFARVESLRQGYLQGSQVCTRSYN